MRFWLSCGVVCLLVPLCAQAQQPDPSAVLAQSESEFVQQRYRSVVRLLKPLLHPDPKLESPDDQQRARELLAASHWFLQEFEPSRQEFQFLLLKRPGFELDAFVYPKAIRDFLEELRGTLIRQGLIPDLSAATDPKEPKPPTVMRVTQIIQSQSRTTAFMPFGVAQFEYGAPEWGAFFATTQGLAALGNIGTNIAWFALRESGEKASTLNGLATGALITGTTLIGLYIWSVIDGNLRHKPMRVLSVRSEELTPKEAADLRLPQPQLNRETPDVPQPVAPGGSPR